MGNLEKSRECFVLEKDSPDAALKGIGRWTRAFGVLLVSSAGVECASDADTECGHDNVRAFSGA